MERYKVIISPEARSDMRDIARYISADLREPAAAERTAVRLGEAAFSLKTMPDRYPLVSDDYLASRGIRAASAGNYLLFYAANSRTKEVNVFRVLYGKRDWVNILTKDL